MNDEYARALIAAIDAATAAGIAFEERLELIPPRRVLTLTMPITHNWQATAMRLFAAIGVAAREDSDDAQKGADDGERDTEGRGKGGRAKARADRGREARGGGTGGRARAAAC